MEIQWDNICAWYVFTLPFSFLLPVSQKNNAFCCFHDARKKQIKNTPIVKMRKPRRIWGSSRSEGTRDQSPDFEAPLRHVCCDRWLLRPQRRAPQTYWGEQRAYWKHLGWGFPTGFSVWPCFQAIKLHWNICSLIDCCFNNKPMFVLLSTSNGKDPPRSKRGLFFGTFCSKAAEWTETVKRNRALIPSAVRETTLAKEMGNRTAHS